MSIAYGYGIVKWREVRLIFGQRDIDLEKRQNISRPFLQAQNEIREDILRRRQELIAQKILSEEDYKKFMELNNPFIKNDDKPLYKEK